MGSLVPAKPASSSLRIGRAETGLGLFATAPIKRGALIAEYVGERITNAEADRRRSKYLFETSERYSIDGATKANLARYINHSCAPNARAEITERGRVFIYATRRIEAGEEIAYNYGRNYFETIIEPLGCRCDLCLARARRRKAKTRLRKAGRARLAKAA